MIGQRIGNYEITEEIGRGGMAVVYKANDLNLDRTVAIKVLPEQFTFDEEFIERFAREARTAANLTHPNIITIHQVGKEGDTHYFAMNYIEGRSLSKMIREDGKLPVDKALKILQDVCGALEHAHARGVIHRDIKSDNILLDEQGNAIVTDFGIAKAAEGTRLTQTGTSIGTPEYMSPEQANGQPLDNRSDIYSLGIVMYEMLTGQVPFQAETPIAVAVAHTRDMPTGPRQLSADIPEWFEAIVMKCLAKNPDERYQSAAELLADLQARRAPGAQPAVGATRVVRQEEVAEPLSETPPPVAPEETTSPSEVRTPTPPPTVPAQRNVIPWIAGLGGLAVILAIVAIIFATRGGGGPKAISPPSSTRIEQTKTPAQQEAERRQQQLDNLLNRASRYYANAEYQQAIDALTEALNIEPGHPEAQKLKNQAIDALAKRGAEQAKQQKLTQHLANAKSHLEAGVYDSALEEAEKALQLEPDNSEALDYKRQAQTKMAEQARQQTAAVTRQKIQTYLSQARSFLNKQLYPEALTEVEKSLTLDATHQGAKSLKSEIEGAQRQVEAEKQRQIETAFSAGKTAYEAGQFDEAIRNFDRVLAQDAQHSEAQTYKMRAESAKQTVASKLAEGRRAYNQGDYQTAVDALDAVLQLVPQHSEAKRLKEEAQPAIAEADKAERIRTLLARGNRYLRDEEYDRAITAFDDVLALDSTNTDARQGKRDAQRAQARAKEEQRKQQGVAGAIRSGKNYQRQKEYQKAIDEFDKALALDRSNSEARRLKSKAEEALEAAKAPPKTITGKDGAEMMLIPAGEFQMGSNDGNSNEKPVHTVHLDAFYMDKYEVTNEKYARFLNDYGKNADAAGHELIDLDDEDCLIEKSGGVYRPKSGYANHPVIEVTWYGAAAYAQYYGERMPTEAEWEKAARGGLVGKKYPWGDNIDSTKANYDSDRSRRGTTEHMLKYLKAVGSFPANGYGLYDMAGNVWEWCADGWDENYYSKSSKNNPKGPGTPVLFVNNYFTNVKNTRVCRGGSWYFDPIYVRCAFRVWGDPSFCFFLVGFRLVLSSRSIPR